MCLCPSLNLSVSFSDLSVSFSGSAALGVVTYFLHSKFKDFMNVCYNELAYPFHLGESLRWVNLVGPQGSKGQLLPHSIPCKLEPGQLDLDYSN